MGVALIATKGYAAPEVERNFARARELCQRVGETPLLLYALSGLRVFYCVKGEVNTARRLAEQGFRSAQILQDVDLLLEFHGALGETLFVVGEFDLARPILERGVTLAILTDGVRLGRG